jgi:hypothetical protein
MVAAVMAGCCSSQRSAFAAALMSFAAVVAARLRSSSALLSRALHSCCRARLLAEDEPHGEQQGDAAGILPALHSCAVKGPLVLQGQRMLALLLLLLPSANNIQRLSLDIGLLMVHY